MLRTRRAVLTLSLVSSLAASALGAGAAHAAAWLPGPTLTQQSAYAAPQTAIGADDGAAVLTTEVDVFGSPVPSVIVRRLAPDGTQLAQFTIGKGYGVDVVALPGGGYRVAWVSPGPPSNQLVVATVDAAGRVGGPRAVNVEALNEAPVGVVAADGSAVVAWKGQGNPRSLRVLQVGADGGTAPIADLGPVADNSTPPQLVRSSDGSARLLWLRPAQGNTTEQMIGRVSPAGVSATAVLDVKAVEGTARLAAGGGDPVVVWLATGNVVNYGDVLVSRLPASGPVAGAATTMAAGVTTVPGTADVVIATDGTATVVWSRFDPQWVTSTLHSRQLAPSGALGPEREISPPTGYVELDATPRVRIARNGTMVVQWFRGFPAVDAQLKGLSKVLDSSGAAAGPELAVPYTLPLAAIAAPGIVDVTVAPSGTGLLVGAAPSGGGSPATPLVTARFDSTPPTLDPIVPATAVRGTAAAFAARAGDGSGIAKVTWQFGDGASTDGTDVTHAYGASGPQTVTVTATDVAGESTSVTRGIAVSEPPPAPSPTPTPNALASAKLRVTKATRKGARVTVAGTIDRRASGRVTITWSQKSGRKTVKRTVHAKIAKGRFTATIKLSRALARSRVVGRLSVTYAGDRTLRRTTVTRTVKAPARKASGRR